MGFGEKYLQYVIIFWFCNNIWWQQWHQRQLCYIYCIYYVDINIHPQAFFVL